MNRIALASLVLGITAAAPSAFAQCPPGSWLCADITIGTAPPPPTTVYVQPPPPPPVIVQPAPPPPRRVIVVPPPAPVVVQPAPVVVYQPAPPVQQTYVMPPPTQYTYYPTPRRQGYVGLQGQLGGAFFGGAGGAMGAFGAGLRVRDRGHWGGELALNLAGGTDYNGDLRGEIPLTLTGMFFFNPQHRFQLYGLAGFGLSFAAVDYTVANRVAHGGRRGGEYAYLGAHAGIGGELQLTPSFSLFADVRGFLRGRIDDERDNNPEFARNVVNGSTVTTQTTNTSAGVFSQLGAVWYF
jgi:hypothetical protein